MGIFLLLQIIKADVQLRGSIILVNISLGNRSLLDLQQVVQLFLDIGVVDRLMHLEYKLVVNI